MSTVGARTLHPARRAWFIAGLAMLIAVVGVSPAAAVGVAGVDLTVDLPTDGDDRPQLDRAADEVTALLRNLEDESRTVSLYAVAATPNQEGSFALGGPASAEWFGLGEHTVTLEPREERTFVAQPRHRSIPQEATHLAVVLEAGTDTTLVTRAARIIELRGEVPAGLPWWLIALAVALLVTTLGAHLWRWYDERRRATPTSGRPCDVPHPSEPSARVPEPV